MINLEYNYINPKTLKLAGSRMIEFKTHVEFMKEYRLAKLDKFCAIKVMFGDSKYKNGNDLKLQSLKEINV